MKKKGFPVKTFYKRGNGIKTILYRTGRLADFKGLFVFSSKDGKAVFVKESENVLQEIQQTVRGERVKDRKFLEKIANTYGFNTSLAGQAYLKSMEVKWIEIFQKSKRLALFKASKSIKLSSL